MSRGAAVLRGVLAAREPGANAIPLFVGENRTFDGEAGPALAVSIYSETGLWMIATLRALYDAADKAATRRASQTLRPYNRETGADDGWCDDNAVR